MKIPKMRRAILHFSTCGITFAAACAADAYAFLFDQLGMKLPRL